MTSIAIQSVKQHYTITDRKVLNFLETFRYMVNHSIRIGLQNDCTTMKRLCMLSYHELEQYDIPSYYKLCAISKAAGILASRKKSIRRGYSVKSPYMKKPILVSCYGFKYQDGIMKVPLGERNYLDISLNHYCKKILSADPRIKIRSFTLTANHISISYSKEVAQIKCDDTAGIDRNLGNLTIGNCTKVIQFDLSRTVQIAENTKSIYSSFKRNDSRIRKKIYSKYGNRRKNRINQILHKVSKTVVGYAITNKTALVFEDIRHIRKLYQKGNWQGRQYRGRMNGWSFSEIKRQIEYKARWNGIPIIQLSKKETMGTSSRCPVCGERLRKDMQTRNLFCDVCKKRWDRDVVAVMNQSLRGWVRFAHSKGLADEAMVQEYGSKEPLILRVDAGKSCLQQETRQNRSQNVNHRILV